MNLYMIYYFLVRFGSAATLFCGSLRTLKLDANYDTNSNCYSTKTEIKKMNHATDFLCGRRGGAVMSLIGHSVKEIEVIVDTFSCSGQSRV
jgi:hypothetical protein